MKIRRTVTHLFMTERQLRSVFPEASLSAIEGAIGVAEASHGGEICFVVEGALHSAQLMTHMTARERALEVFSHLRVWDTEHNNGVLIYVLLADRAVEIVADRHIHNKAGGSAWEGIAKAMEACFRHGAFLDGALEGVHGVATQLASHFPARGSSRNELANRPTLL